MADPFRRLVLDTVQVVVDKDPCGESLHELLRIATPDLAEGDVYDSEKREKLFKALKLRIHPDKHPGDKRATKLFQDVQQFYNKCVANLRRPPRRSASTGNNNAPARTQMHSRSRSSGNPFEFNVRSKWPFLLMDQPSLPTEGCTPDGLASLVAYQCINARGAIAHGKKTERYYSAEQVLKKTASVYDKFDLRGGVKTIEGEDAIKREIMTHGPVVSTSFFLTDAFARRSEHSGAFLLNMVGKKHPVLICGWRLTSFGEMWLIQPLKRSPNEDVLVPISVGQFGIDDVCLAPKSSFEDIPWENGPYFDQDMSSAPKWRTWKSLKMTLTTNELERLFAECGTEDGIISMHEKKSTFVIRDKTKFAHSRRCRLREVQWDKKHKKWNVAVAFV